MHTRLPQHLLIVFFSSLLQQVNSSVISCLRSSTTDRGHQRVTFLREDAAGARSLFRTVWLSDAATMRMLSCRISKNPGDVEHYQTAVCDSSLEDLSLTRFVNVSVMNEVDTNCAPQKKMRSRAREEAVVKIRRKRGWIFPGTLWCGMNTKAATYDELGMFENADSCCREHDHCEHTIPSFTVNYGVFNPNLYTLSHCDCDQSFRKCLLGVNDTISTMVGYSFFNILRVPCFELKEQQQCTKMYWWGMCKVTRKAPYAVLKTSHLYNSSHVSTNEANSNNSNNSKETKHEEKQTTKITGINMQQKSPKIQSRCRSRDPFLYIQQLHLLLVTDHELLCKSLKHLDECRHQITPLEKKYGLWNKESKTVYHCNCTTRCSRFIKAYDLIRRLKKMKTKGTAWSKLPGSDQKRGIPVRLYKRCLRLERGIDNVEQLTW
uniref:phospholipase A2 n=1 Tax=Cynoglossus semilaevis TaxID=244447 RepID=A0A3P8WNE9_CYNSE